MARVTRASTRKGRRERRERRRQGKRDLYYKRNRKISQNVSINNIRRSPDDKRKRIIKIIRE